MKNFLTNIFIVASLCGVAWVCVTVFGMTAEKKDKLMALRKEVAVSYWQYVEIISDTTGWLKVTQELNPNIEIFCFRKMNFTVGETYTVTTNNLYGFIYQQKIK